MKKSVLVLTIVLGLVATAQAVSISQSWEFGQTEASMYADQSTGRVNLGITVASSTKIEWANAHFRPNDWDTSEWVWTVSVAGRLGTNPVEQSFGMYTDRSSSDIGFTQSTTLDWWPGDEMIYPAYDVAYASADIFGTGAAFRYAECDPNEWQMSWPGSTLPTENWWEVQYRFYGSFGDTPEADVAGANFFNVAVAPEPTTFAALIGGGMFAMLRRRR